MEHLGLRSENPDDVSDAIVVGAGPAGLAVGACLRKAGLSFQIVDKSDKIASSWHAHYDQLRLHTNRRTSQLPYLPLPRRFRTYPARLQFIQYLEDYADRFQLSPSLNQEVLSARFRGGKWHVHTRDGWYRSPNLIIATGNTAKPNLPVYSGWEGYRGEVLHSSRYQNGQAFGERDVLVVGFGNSAGEIAMDLNEHGARVSMSVRGPINIITRDLLGIPVLALAVPLSKLPARLVDASVAPLSRLLYGDQERLGLRRLPYGPTEQITRTGKVPLVDVGAVALIRAGQIRVRPGISRFTEDGVVFVDGRHEAYDAVVMATGYTPDAGSFLDSETRAAVIDEEGRPYASGRETAPGLYFCGFHVGVAGTLREISKEAKAICRSIVEKRDPMLEGSQT